MRMLLLAIPYFLIAAEVDAASWYRIHEASSSNALYFFDKETVVKSDNKVTIWIKAVFDPQNLDTDGTRATASKVAYSCDKRTNKYLTSSTYDTKGNFVRSYPKALDDSDIVPDTIAEEILNTVCKQNFPNDKSGKIYFAIKDNDILSYTSSLFEKKRARTVDNAPSNSSWYKFYEAFNDRSHYYFDMNSVVRDADTISLWVLYVMNPSEPDTDGSHATGAKSVFDCNRKTYSNLAYSMYDNNGAFLNSFVPEIKVIEPKKGTLSEAMLGVVCSPDFPLAEGVEGSYFKLHESFTPLTATALYFGKLESKKNDTAPQ